MARESGLGPVPYSMGSAELYLMGEIKPQPYSRLSMNATAVLSAFEQVGYDRPHPRPLPCPYYNRSCDRPATPPCAKDWEGNCRSGGNGPGYGGAPAPRWVFQCQGPVSDHCRGVWVPSPIPQ